jgi:hypothetical protein
LAAFAFDDDENAPSRNGADFRHRRRSGLTFGNGTSQAYIYDPVSRLKTLKNDLANTASDLTQTFGYTPASQVGSVVRTNDTYAWTGHGNGTTVSAANGLNQVTSIGGAAPAYDPKGNLTTDPTSGKTYSYTSENLLKYASGGGVPAVNLTYDPLMRLYDSIGASSGTGSRWAYDGLEMIAEYNELNALQRRFVFGPAVDEPLVQYEGTGTTDRRFLHADERGSIVAVSDSVGTKLSINTYDEYGTPGAANGATVTYDGKGNLTFDPGCGLTEGSRQKTSFPSVIYPGSHCPFSSHRDCHEHILAPSP